MEQRKMGIVLKLFLFVFFFYYLFLNQMLIHTFVWTYRILSNVFALFPESVELML